MEAWQREYLRKTGPFLIENTEYGPLQLLHLKSFGVLSDCDVNAIDGIPTKFGRIFEIYECAKKKLDGYKQLLFALRAAREKTAVDMLEKGYLSQGLPIPTQVEEKVSPEQKLPVPPTPGSSQPQGVDEVDLMDSRKLKPLKVSVVRPQTRMAFPNDIYNLPETDKGYALLFNIIEFDNEVDERHGAEMDTRNLNKLLSTLGYKITIQEGHLTYDEFKTHLTTFKTSVPSDAKSCIVFVGSHGVYTKLDASDYKPIHLYKDIVYQFNSEACPQMDGKPKIFIIQACQKFETDFEDEKVTMPINNAIICFSTIPGYAAARRRRLGTWYIYCLTKVFMGRAHNKSLLELLEETQNEMGNKEVTKKNTIGQLSTWSPFGLQAQHLYFNMSPLP